MSPGDAMWRGGWLDRGPAGARLVAHGWGRSWGEIGRMAVRPGATGPGRRRSGATRTRLPRRHATITRPADTGARCSGHGQGQPGVCETDPMRCQASGLMDAERRRICRVHPAGPLLASLGGRTSTEALAPARRCRAARRGGSPSATPSTLSRRFGRDKPPAGGNPARAWPHRGVNGASRTGAGGVRHTGVSHGTRTFVRYCRPRVLANVPLSTGRVPGGCPGGRQRPLD